VASLSPFRLGEVALAVHAGEVTTVRPVSGLSFEDLGLDLRLTGRQALLLAGEVRVAQASYDVSKRKRARPARPPSPATVTLRKLRDQTWLDLELRSDEARVRIPVAPDVTLAISCDVAGPARAPRMSGELSAPGLYSRSLLALADWFSDRDLRRCDFGPR
jgi:hypothetical protein